MTLVRRPSLKCTDIHGQKFRPNNIHYAFISIVMILVNFQRKSSHLQKVQVVYFKHEANKENLLNSLSLSYNSARWGLIDSKCQMKKIKNVFLNYLVSIPQNKFGLIYIIEKQPLHKGSCVLSNRKWFLWIGFWLFLL